MNLIIVGAGGMGREIFSWLSHEIKNKSDHKIIGFIDDNSTALQGYNYPISIISSIKDYIPQKTEKLVLAIMEPKIKKQITNSLLSKGAIFYTLIHPSVILGYNIKIGAGCVVAPNCIITVDTIIHDFVFINTDVGIGHDVVIHNHTSINGKSEITGGVTIGAESLLGSNVKIIPNIKVGNKARIGAGSVVIGDVEANVTVFGNPAKKIFG